MKRINKDMKFISILDINKKKITINLKHISYIKEGNAGKVIFKIIGDSSVIYAKHSYDEIVDILKRS